MNKSEYQAIRSALKSALRWHHRRINELEIRLAKLDDTLTPGELLRPKHPWPLQLRYNVRQ